MTCPNSCLIKWQDEIQRRVRPPRKPALSSLHSTMFHNEQKTNFTKQAEE